jgi:stage IV sporulation protein FB
VEINFFFFAVVAAASLGDTNGVLLCGILAAAVHEAGHLCVMLNIKELAPRKIKISPVGIKIIAGGSSEDSRYWCLAALAGVGANLLFSLALLLPSLYFKSEVITKLILSNLLLAGVNILPAHSLDGGQLLKLLLKGRMSESGAETVLLIVSAVMLIPVLTLGVIILIKSQYNYSLLALSLWLVMIVFHSYLKK